MTEVLSYPNGHLLTQVDNQPQKNDKLHTAVTPKRPSKLLWYVTTALLLLIFIGLMASKLIPFDRLSANFPTDVLAILIALDLFSIYVVQTGSLDKIGFQLALATKGRPDIAAIFMGMLMFVSSAVLNNLAAIFILAPMFLTLLRAMKAPRQIIATFLSLMLVLCNLGGMATPMGDFPAILLMSSGLVEFTPYLTLAFPLASSLALIAIISYATIIQRQKIALIGGDDEARTRVSLELMRVQNRHIKPDYKRALLITIVFASMVIAWAIIPSTDWPFYMTALIGAAAATLIAGPKLSVQAIKSYDLRTTIIMGGILTIAAIVAATGILQLIAEFLVASTTNSTLLLAALMVIVAIAAGLFSAGPATAAILPIFITLSEGPLSVYGDLVGIAFAASICAGSSMLLHSATAGPTLRGETVKAGFSSANGKPVWGHGTYLKYGFATCIVQLGFSIIWILLAGNMPTPWLINFVPFALTIAVIGAIVETSSKAEGTRSMFAGNLLKNSGLILALGVTAYAISTTLDLI